jgi:polyisoprenyl-teichoic acid--peptidoglycan teichoic acid transferase
MLSIPRDLWVPIPGFQQGRINTANQLGDAYELPGGGPALAARTVEAAFGIPVDKYVRVNFDFFLHAVDVLAPDGIEVCPNEVIDDPKYPDAGYGTIHVRFEAGCQHLNSERLLQYARTRATEGGDFDRARRQQEVLKSIQREFLSVGGIANFITQAPILWNELSGKVVTNLSFEEVLALANFASQMRSEDITSGVIDAAYTQFATTAQNDQVLVPRYARIGTLIQQVFNPRPNMTLADLRTEAEREGASIVVYNNTTISGLAANTRDWLASRQVSVQTIGSIEVPTSTDTVIRDYTGNPMTARYLAALLGLSESRIQASSDGLTSADIMIVVGPDIQTLLSEQP